MKIKVFERNIKPELGDDFTKALAYFKEKANLPVVFERSQTNVRLKDVFTLAKENDGKCDVVMYLFDRKEEGVAGAWCQPYSNTTCLSWIPTGVEEDPSGYHWYTIAHEIVHSFFQLLRAKGIVLADTMDFYDKNWDPYAPDGNFARNLAVLKPYMHLFGATSPVQPLLPTVEVVRNTDDPKQTTGILTAFNNGAKFTCRTLERPWENNAPNVSAIPKGSYTCKWTFSMRFLRRTYEVLNVPKRSGIRFHSANYFHQLNGCIALGDKLLDINGDGHLDTTNSKITTTAWEKFMNYKPFTLIIK